MAAYAFTDVAGTTLASFDPAVDTLHFPADYIFRPRNLTLTASGPDTVVEVQGGTSVILAGVALGELDGSQFVFAMAGVFGAGTSAADSWNGTSRDDHFDLSAGGDDTIIAGEGEDVVTLGASFSAGDFIDGGAGNQDEVRLFGNYESAVVLDAALVRGVEVFWIGTGGTVRLQVTDGIFEGVSYPWVVFNGSSQQASDAMYIDAREMDRKFEVQAGLGFDTLLGGSGNDDIRGGGGDNLLSGHAGHDRLFVAGAGNSTLFGGDGDDEISTRDGSGRNILYGGAGSDGLAGGSGADVLYAAGAQDESTQPMTDDAGTTNYLYGYGGDDVLAGDNGSDSLAGGSGRDTLTGGAGNDTLDGTLDGDTLVGGTGDDQYHIRDEADVVTEEGGGGMDTLVLHIQRYTLAAGVENAEMARFWEGGAVHLTGNEEANALSGTDFDDTLFGAAGADTLFGGYNGQDSLVGGTGDDVYKLQSGGIVVERGDAGTDRVIYVGDRYVLPKNVEQAEITTWWAELVGNALDNLLVAKSYGCKLVGGAGDDTLNGSSAGGIRMSGGSGNDTFFVSNMDRVHELPGVEGGVDEVIAESDWKLGTGLENLTLGTYAVAAVGNSLHNVLRGNALANTLDGREGADTMIGSDGADSYIVDDAGDVVVEDATGGVDTVIASMSYVLGQNFERLYLSGAVDVRMNGTGNAVDNYLRGHAGQNLLNGRVGADTMEGYGGDDTYIIDNVGDVVIETGAWDHDTIISSVNVVMHDGVESLVLTGTAWKAVGNAGNNDLTGTDADDWLDGRFGDDTLQGGAGDDTLIGGMGSDTYFVDSVRDRVVETGGYSWELGDVVVSTISYTLGALMEELTLSGTDDLRGTGNDGDNTIRGNSGNNRLDGRGGRDTLMGGLGDDIYVVDDPDDWVLEYADGGTDTVRANFSFELFAFQENGVLTGSEALDLRGNSYDNRLSGNAAGNRLDGGTGADTLQAGAGNDTYVVDNAGDVVMERAGGGTDTVLASVTHVLGAYQESLVLTGWQSINGKGNATANVLQGNDGDNTLDGGRGVDTMDGGDGADIYIVDDSRDVASETVIEFDKADAVVSSADYSLGANMEILVLVGRATVGVGNYEDNIIVGNARDNVLVGGYGYDELHGGAGSDLFEFRSAPQSWDLIVDFERGQDKLDVSRLGVAGMPMQFNGNGASLEGPGGTGHLWFEMVAGGIVLYGNVSGSPEPDFAVALAGVSSLEESDFVL